MFYFLKFNNIILLDMNLNVLKKYMKRILIILDKLCLKLVIKF